MTSKSKGDDMHYGQLAMLTSTPNGDMKHNIDYIIGDLMVAWRRRRLKLSHYNEVSIRYKRASGTETEMSKILNGKCEAKLYVFEFLDCWVICKVSDIATCLRGKHFKIKLNRDRITSAAYININDLPHLLLQKEESQ